MGRSAQSRSFRAGSSELSVDLRQGTCRPLPERRISFPSGRSSSKIAKKSLRLSGLNPKLRLIVSLICYPLRENLLHCFDRLYCRRKSDISDQKNDQFNDLFLFPSYIEHAVNMS